MSPRYGDLDVSDDTALLAGDIRRIADTLDDYMEMSLAGIELTQAVKAKASDPDVAAMIRPLTDVLVRIRERRAAR